MAEAVKSLKTKNKTHYAKKKEDKKKKSQTREYTEAILVALLAALFIRTFIIQAFKIPTGSMKDTLLVGDFLLVNKFVYGARTPDSIPFTNVTLPYLRLPAFKEPEPGEIVVFKFPDSPVDEAPQDYIKRCIAGPGQMFEIKDGNVFVDGQPEGKKELIRAAQYEPNEGQSVEYYRMTRNDGKTFILRQFVGQNLQSRHFPRFRIPKKGDTIALTPELLDSFNGIQSRDTRGREMNTTLYRKIIEKYEGHTIRVENGKVLLDGVETASYTFKHDYFFMMGDNRDNSSDSRVWGVLPRENVVGEALIIYWSWDWDWDKPLYEIFTKVRWGRLGNVIR